jgi:hypothetical protein
VFPSASWAHALQGRAELRYHAFTMRPLEAEHQGWTIRVIARPVGRAWSALVEVWPPGSPKDAEGRLVPFSATLGTEKLAQAAGRDAAIRWLDRETNRAAEPRRQS